MRLILMGPPGAGKGTQAELIAGKLFVSHISTGDLFRAAMAAETKLGVVAKEYINNGKLVPDELTMGIVEDRLSQSDCSNGFLLDGIPRNLTQADALEAMLTAKGVAVDKAINIVVPLENLVERLSGRRVCPKCGASYHLMYAPPTAEGICDKCGSTLYQREDDSAQTVTKRLETYTSQSLPVEEFYQKRGLLVNVNGDQPINKVLAEIGAALGKDWA